MALARYQQPHKEEDRTTFITDAFVNKERKNEKERDDNTDILEMYTSLSIITARIEKYYKNFFYKSKYYKYFITVIIFILYPLSLISNIS